MAQTITTLAENWVDETATFKLYADGSFTFQDEVYKIEENNKPSDMNSGNKYDMFSTRFSNANYGEYSAFKFKDGIDWEANDSGLYRSAKTPQEAVVKLLAATT